MMGNYGWVSGIPPKLKALDLVHTFYMFIHLYIANVFLLNYLVAILATVYGDSMESGRFAYNKCKYAFIERYMVAFDDKKGYF